MTSKNQKIEWDFKQINFSDYEAEIDMYSDNRLLLMIFNQSKKKLKKKNINIIKKIDIIERFEIDDRYLNMVKTIIRPVIKDIQKSIRTDGYELLSSKVDTGFFERDKNRNWKIKLYINGQYADKR